MPDAGWGLAVALVVALAFYASGRSGKRGKRRRRR